MKKLYSILLLAIFTAVALLASSCSPKVEVAVPDKPININLNVKIEHEVRIKVEKDLDQVISEDSSLF